MADPRDRSPVEQLEWIRCQREQVEAWLARGVAHRVGNDLMVCQSQLDQLLTTLDEDSPGAKQGELIDLLLSEAGESIAVLQQYSTSASAGLELLDLASVIQNAHPMLRLLLRRSIELELTLPSAPVWIGASRGDLLQVVLTLTEQTKELMPQGGQLTIVVASAGSDQVQLVFRAAVCKGMDYQSVFGAILDQPQEFGPPLDIAAQVCVRMGGRLEPGGESDEAWRVVLPITSHPQYLDSTTEVILVGGPVFAQNLACEALQKEGAQARRCKGVDALEQLEATPGVEHCVWVVDETEMKEFEKSVDESLTQFGESMYIIEVGNSKSIVDMNIPFVKNGLITKPYAVKTLIDTVKALLPT